MAKLTGKLGDISVSKDGETWYDVGKAVVAEFIQQSTGRRLNVDFSKDRMRATVRLSYDARVLCIEFDSPFDFGAKSYSITFIKTVIEETDASQWLMGLD